MTLNLRGQIMDFAAPQIMGIVNVTPDSFFSASRTMDGAEVVARARQLLSEGAAILDIGGCSTRPGSEPVSEDEEWRRLSGALEALRREFPSAVLSVDTFRARIAERSVQDYGVQIINDISGGLADEQMFETVAALTVPYVLTHGCGFTDVTEVPRFLAGQLQTLYRLGVADVLLDPGFGFGKTLEQNYQLMARLADLTRLFPDNPVLVGVSRKSMIHRLLNIQPEEALNGTTVLHTLALQAGAKVLRVHDVRAAAEAARIWEAVCNGSEQANNQGSNTLS